MTFQKLNPSFYLSDSPEVARQLLGKLLVHKLDNKVLYGRIVETEAYGGAEDAASHAWKGQTPRNTPMFAAGGISYVYFTYGVHFCFNVVTGPPSAGQAVLIRAIEPLGGQADMRLNRFGATDAGTELNLCNGPGKLCKAMGLSRHHNGMNLSGLTLFIAEGDIYPPEEIYQTTRIGISRAADVLWRFYLTNNKFISRK